MSGRPSIVISGIPHYGNDQDILALGSAIPSTHGNISDCEHIGAVLDLVLELIHKTDQGHRGVSRASGDPWLTVELIVF
jgi:hypothetical protein